jgi:hypothetical protein
LKTLPTPLTASCIAYSGDSVDESVGDLVGVHVVHNVKLRRSLFGNVLVCNLLQLEKKKKSISKRTR